MQDARGRSTRSSKRFDTVPEPQSLPDNDAQNSQGDAGQYMCIECSETFHTKLQLNSHRQCHVTQKQFTCTHCGRGFHHQVFLEMHERSHEDGMCDAPVTRTPGRIISTRSSKAVPSLTADVVHVLPAPPKQPGRLVNSVVDFQREKKVVPEFTPLECVTRRTHGTPQISGHRRDSTETKNRFELRIAKVLDTTIHLIDPFGNTLEILSEVFNKYTISDSEQDPGVGEMSAEEPVASAFQEPSDDLNVMGGPQEDSPEVVLPQAEAFEPEKDTEMEEDLTSYDTSLVSADKPLDAGEDSSLLLGPVSTNSKDNGEAPSHEHSMIQPDIDIPKSLAHEESTKPVAISQNDSLLNDQTGEMVEAHQEIETDSKPKGSDSSPVEGATLPDNDVISAETAALMENAELDIVDERPSTAPLDQERDPSVQEIPGTESCTTPSKSLAHEMPVTDDQERALQEDSNQQPLLNDASVKEMSFLLSMNTDHVELDTLCEADTGNPSTKFDMSLSGWEDLSRRVNHGQILDQLSDTETSDLGDGKPAESIDEETVAVLEEQSSPEKQEVDHTLPELPLNINQGQSCPEDLNYISNRKTEGSASSEDYSGQPNLIFSNSENTPVKDGGIQDAEQETSSQMDVYDKTTPERAQNLDFVAQEAAIFTAESEPNSLSQVGSSDLEKKMASVVEDEEKFMMEEMDTDLFDGRDILPLDAQVEVGEKIHIPNEPSIVIEREMDNDNVAHKPAMELCVTENDKLAETVYPAFSFASENKVISPVEEVTREKTLPEHNIDVECSLDKGEQLEVCSRQDSNSRPTCQDAECKIHPSDIEKDLGLQDNAGIAQCSLSSHVFTNRLPREASQVADVRDDTASSGVTLAEDSVSHNISLHQQNLDEMQVTAPDAEPAAIIRDADESRTLKERDGFMHDDTCVDKTDQIHLTEDSSTNREMVNASEEEQIPFPQSDATTDLEAGTNGKLEHGGDSPSPPTEVCLSMTIDEHEGISEDKSTCASEDQENIFPEQKVQIEQENSHPTSELCTLQSNPKDTVFPGSTDIRNDEIVLNTFTGGDFNSYRLRNESEGSVEKALPSETHSTSSDLEGDTIGAQDESKVDELDESLPCEHLESTQVADFPLNECQESDQEKAEISLSNKSDPGEDAIMGEPSNENLSAGDLITEAAVSSSQIVPPDDALDATDVLQLVGGVGLEESTDAKTSTRSVEAGSQCLNCGRKLRRSRKDTILSTVCFKCRLVTKRQERLTNKELSESQEQRLEKHSACEERGSSLSDIKIKVEADKDDVSVEMMKPSISTHKESASKKLYKCQKCDQSFRIPALLAGHMKTHTLPQCLTCGCQMKLKYKTRRIPRRCQKCVQEIKEQKKDVLMTDEKSGDEESANSDAETFVSDNQSEIPEGDLSDGELSLSSIKPHRKAYPKLKEQSVGVSRGSELVQSVLLKKNKKVKPSLYCVCETPRTSASGQSVKKCQHCQKLIRDQKTNPPSFEEEELIAGHLSDLSDISHDGDLDLESKLKKCLTEDKKRPLKKVKKATQSLDSELVFEGNSVTESEVISCKKEDLESSSDEQVISDLILPDGEKPRLCLQCGKAFKCNRSLNLHLLSHNTIQCELCGCRLQKKRRAGRWPRKCRICRLRGRDESFSADDTSEKCVTTLQMKVQQPKIVKNRKIKHKKDLKWKNMMAVKGLQRKRALKSLDQSNSEADDDVTGVTPLPEYDLDVSAMEQPGPSGLTDTPKKRGRKCVYKEKNIIKMEENQLLPDNPNPAASMTPVSIKQEEENQCLECNQNLPNLDLLLLHQQSHIEGQPFSCSQCPQSFSKEQYLNIHQNTHPEGRPFRCPECNKTFTRRNHLGVHLRVHSGLRRFSCPDCPCKFRQKGSLIIHRYTHRNIQALILKPYQCSVCSKSFKLRERLIVHERIHTGECPFSCKDCDKVFPSKTKLYMHRKLHKMSDGSFAVEPNLDSKEEAEIQSFKCQDCDKVCSTKASFVLHCKIHRPSSKQDVDQEQNLEGLPFHCRKCNEVFSTKAELALHKKLHRKAETQGKPFICKDCNKVCSTKASFVLHRKVHKNLPISEKKLKIKAAAIGTFVCKHCGKVCSTKASFVLHSKVHKLEMSETLQKTSLVPQTFTCKECNVVCATKSSFVLHSKIHKSSSGEQNPKAGPFTCQDCDKVCSTKASFALHRKVHKSLSSSEQNINPREDVTECPLECKDCGNMFTSQEQLSAHSKDHAQEETSSICDQILSNKVDGEEPQKTDIDEKPFACPTCDMRFKRLKILLRHKLLHGEEGIFTCVHCGKRFLFQKSLLNHGKICQSRNKGKKLAAKRKNMKVVGPSSLGEENVQKKRKTIEKKVLSDAQKEKKKKLLKAKKLAMIKEKCKIKAVKEKKKLKEKRPKAGGESDPETSHGKQEKPLDLPPKEKKSKDVTKPQKVVKKVTPKDKQQKSKSLKKWQMIASTTVHKRKLQAALNVGKKKKVEAKKKGPVKAKTGAKEKN